MYINVSEKWNFRLLDFYLKRQRAFFRQVFNFKDFFIHRNRAILVFIPKGCLNDFLGWNDFSLHPSEFV